MIVGSGQKTPNPTYEEQTLVIYVIPHSGAMRFSYCSLRTVQI